MSRCRATAPVRMKDGTVSTIGEQAILGRVRFTKTDKWHSPRSATGVRTAYFANFHDAAGEYTGSVEISRFLYESRTREGFGGCDG